MLPRILLISLLSGIIFICSIKIFNIELQRKTRKEDLIELSKIKYGLFSVDEWKQIISRILTKKIEEINFNPDQRAEMSIKISDFLSHTIDDLESRYYEEKSNSLIGWLEGGVASVTGIFNKIKKDVPIFTDQILDFLSNENNREKVKEFILEKLNEYADKTFSKIDYTEHNRILSVYGFGDRGQTIAGLDSDIKKLYQSERVFIGGVFLSILIIILLIILSPSISKPEYLIYTITCLFLLSSGLLLPMIEIDARINEMSFRLLGESVTFMDQVLYYKSKSILEVVKLMLTQGKLNVFSVGILVLTFSVLFPVSKLLSSLAYVYNPEIRSKRFIRFMVFRTGKWSMADVMVVAIFMSYIGFSGILTEQLNQLENLTRSIDILTTNKSSLQIGFFMFAAFVILSLILADKLQYSSKKL